MVEVEAINSVNAREIESQPEHKGQRERERDRHGERSVLGMVWVARRGNRTISSSFIVHYPVLID